MANEKGYVRGVQVSALRMEPTTEKNLYNFFEFCP